MNNPSTSSSTSIPKSRGPNRNSSIVPVSRHRQNPIRSPEKIVERPRTLITTIVKEETRYGDKTRTVVRYMECAKVFENGKSKVDVLNKLKMVKFTDLNQDSTKSLTFPPSNSQSDVPATSKEGNDSESTEKAKVQKRKLPYICMFVALISILIVFLAIFLSTKAIRMKELRYELSKNVLNQHSAVETFLDSIELLNQPPPKKIITCLIGSSGVGKTYFTNILKNHVDSGTIQIFQPQDLSSLDPSLMRYKLILSDYNILVFDNLKNEDLSQLEHLIEKIMQLKGSNILIIAIFNIQDVDSQLSFSVNHEYSLNIKQRLEGLCDYFYVCKFNELNTPIVEDWLRHKLVADNIDQRHHSNIIAELLKIQDVKNFGLKGIHGKLLLELEKYRAVSS